MKDKSLCVRMTVVGSRQPIEVNPVGQMARPQERLIALADLIILTADDAPVVRQDIECNLLDASWHLTANLRTTLAGIRRVTQQADGRCRCCSCRLLNGSDCPWFAINPKLIDTGGIAALLTLNHLQADTVGGKGRNTAYYFIVSVARYHIHIYPFSIGIALQLTGMGNIVVRLTARVEHHPLANLARFAETILQIGSLALTGCYAPLGQLITVCRHLVTLVGIILMTGHDV